MQGTKIDAVTDHTADDDVGGLAEQARPEHHQHDTGDSQRHDTDQAMGFAAEDRAEPLERGREVLAALGRHPGAAAGTETAPTRLAPGGGQYFLVVLAGSVIAHATAPSPSCDSTISA